LFLADIKTSKYLDAVLYDETRWLFSLNEIDYSIT